MEPEITDAPEVLETQETEVETVETPETDEEALPSKEEIADLRAKAAKAEELEKKNKQLYARATKAESSSKSKEDGLTNKDILYLAKADINPDDLDEVVTYAKKMGVDVADAHKFYKPILEVRAEERRTAEATQTRGARGSAKTTGEDLLQRAERDGDIKVTDDTMRALAEARQARRTASRQR